MNPWNGAQVSIVGPKNTHICVVDLVSEQIIWRARNVKDSVLKLAVEVWDKDSDWVSATKLAVCTAYGHIRLYDIEQGKRQPVLSMSVADESARRLGGCKSQQLTKGDIAFSLNRISCDPSRRHIVAVSSNIGDLWIIDLTRDMLHIHSKDHKHYNCNTPYPDSSPLDIHRGYIVSRQKGLQGAARSVVFHPDYIVHRHSLLVTGLDRFVRSWNIGKSESLGTLYVKLQQNLLVACNALSMFLASQQPENQSPVQGNENPDSESEISNESDSSFISDDNEFDSIWDEIPVLPQNEPKKEKDKKKRKEPSEPEIRAQPVQKLKKRKLM